MGIIFGILAVIWLRLTFNNERIEIIITVVACFLVYWVCDNGIHASGVLGTVFLGLVLSKYKSAVSPQVTESMEHFWMVFSYVMNTLIFIFAGIIVVIGVFEDESDTIAAADLGWNILLYIILHIARGLTIACLWCFLTRMGYGINWQEGVVLTLAGLRGAIALALALMTKLEQLNTIESTPEEIAESVKFKDLVMFHVSMTVFWTLVINGTFIKYVVQGLGLASTSAQAKIILKDTMRHLRKVTKMKVLAMKGNPTFSGANWEEVIRALPSYAHMLGEKDQRQRSMTEKCKHCCDCCVSSKSDMKQDIKPV